MKNLRVLSLSIALLTCTNFACAVAATKSTESPRPAADGWYSLFNGKDFSGWKKSQDNPDSFQVVDGQIVAHGDRCHLYYDGPVSNANFKNFEWKCEILTKPGANSGMYFHARYQPIGWPKTGVEVQVNNTHSDPRKTGSIYRMKDIMDHSPARDNEWFTQHVVVNGRHITVKVNGEVVNEFTWPENFQREEGWEGNVLSSGTFVLQAHDPDSEVHYRKVLVKPLP